MPIRHDNLVRTLRAHGATCHPQADRPVASLAGWFLQWTVSLSGNVLRPRAWRPGGGRWCISGPLAPYLFVEGACWREAGDGVSGLAVVLAPDAGRKLRPTVRVFSGDGPFRVVVATYGDVETL